MPLNINPNRPLNNLTLRLFELIHDDEDNIESIELLLQASSMLLSSEKLRATAINFRGMIDCNHDGKQFNMLTPLDLAIFLKKEQYFDLLCDYIFNCEWICDDDKKIIYTMALMFSIYSDRISFLVNLLENHPRYLLTEMQNVIQYSSMQSPITVAVKFNKLKALTLLLLHNADSTLPDSANNYPLKVAIELDENIDDKQQIISTIHCANEIQLAIKAFNDNDSALTFKHVSGAIKKDEMFTRSYLKTIAWRAVRQLSENHDHIDYRFILEFSRIYTSVLRSPLNLNGKYKGEKEFQNDVIAHLIGAYDCEQANIPKNVKKLFNSNKEKYEFFKAPITGSLLEEGNLKNTLTLMKEKEHLKEDKQGQVEALVASMATNGILLPKNEKNNEEVSLTSSIQELKM